MHRMPVRTVVVRMPGRVEVVVAAGESRVQRPLGPGLSPIQLRVIVIILAAVHFGAAPKHLKTVDETVLAVREVVVESRENGLVESDAGRRSAVPAVSRP